jgi:hypothetical protein
MSQIKANDLTNTTGGIPTVKSQQLIPTAWVNFNGTGTVAIRDSEGVSSITDISTGTYEVNFTTTMANANYAAVSTTDTSRYNSSSGTFATTKFKTTIRNDAATYVDSGVTAIVLGGQA